MIWHTIEWLDRLSEIILLGGNSEWEPPDSISNSVVKTLSADDSVGLPHVKIGHCQAFILFLATLSNHVSTSIPNGLIVGDGCCRRETPDPLPVFGASDGSVADGVTLSCRLISPSRQDPLPPYTFGSPHPHHSIATASVVQSAGLVASDSALPIVAHSCPPHHATTTLRIRSMRRRSALMIGYSRLPDCSRKSLDNCIWPNRPEQRPMFERIVSGVISKLKTDHASSRAETVTEIDVIGLQDG